MKDFFEWIFENAPCALFLIGWGCPDPVPAYLDNALRAVGLFIALAGSGKIIPI